MKYAFPVIVLPEATPLKAVSTIFETLNRTGRPLTPFELISARAFAGGQSLYDLWNGALKQHPILGDYGVKPYYLLQCIALRLGVSRKRRFVISLRPGDGNQPVGAPGMGGHGKAPVSCVREGEVAPWKPRHPADPLPTS